MTAMDLLNQRRSTPSRLLSEPGPDAGQLRAMLAAAIRVPDHGRLAPWRFITLRGQARLALGQALVRRWREREPEPSQAVLDKEGQRFCHAPLVVGVVGRITPGHQIPEQEQLLSGGAVCFALLLAAQGMGFGAQWLTGWAAYDRPIMDLLGLTEHERVLGFIHIGTASEIAPERARPDIDELLTDWTPR